MAGWRTGNGEGSRRRKGDDFSLNTTETASRDGGYIHQVTARAVFQNGPFEAAGPGLKDKAVDACNMSMLHTDAAAVRNPGCRYLPVSVAVAVAARDTRHRPDWPGRSTMWWALGNRHGVPYARCQLTCARYL